MLKALIVFYLCIRHMPDLKHHMTAYRKFCGVSHTSLNELPSIFGVDGVWVGGGSAISRPFE